MGLVTVPQSDIDAIKSKVDNHGQQLAANGQQIEMMRQTVDKVADALKEIAIQGRDVAHLKQSFSEHRNETKEKFIAVKSDIKDQSEKTSHNSKQITKWSMIVIFMCLAMVIFVPELKPLLSVVK